eukprot:CAMPEP_0183514918 /NCGR_PEP_ID=MMETSP0371-20130417/13187_1 /TAXON_ID=268820 /ORGANISM="Peridinium aciculiferum, Strain PAER-2" /LENGTH=388 /DNA_ID=CAMNT_0025712391 /DNA_START=126 /DNA_END=1289 /DNA_ORIENTATION=-
MSFRVAQFNILGRYMAGSMWFHYARDFLPKGLATKGPLEWSRTAGFPRQLLWLEQDGPGHFYRFPVLLAEIRALKADIICLVELDCFAEFRDALGEEGYDAVFEGRPGKYDGCGIFWRRDLFAAAGSARSLVYQVPANDRIALAQPLLHLESNQPLLVVSTHLYWDQSSGHQAAEAEELLAFAYGSPASAPEGPVVLCGDLNTPPGSEAHALLTSHWQDAIQDYEPGAFTSVKPDAYYYAKPRGQQYSNQAWEEWHRQAGRSDIIDYVLFDGGALELEGPPPSLPRLPVPEEGGGGGGGRAAKKPPFGFWAGGWDFTAAPAEGFEESKHDPDWVPARAHGTLQLGIPNRVHGSDHIPVACTLRFRGTQADGANGADAGTAPPQKRPRG